MFTRFRAAYQAFTKSGETSTVSNPAGWFTSLLGSGPTASGKNISPSGALQATAALACVIVLSQDIAKIPVYLYDRKTLEPQINHPVHRLLNRKPNSWQNRYTFRQFVMGQLLTRGNAYPVKLYDQRGRLSALVPVPSDYMMLYESPQGDLFYYLALKGQFFGRQLEPAITEHGMWIPAEYVMHHRGLSLDGIRGVSVLTYAKEAVGLSLATEEHGARMFSNGAQVSGVLESDQTLTQPAIDKLRRQWQEAYSGLSNAFKTVILESGMKWKQVGMNTDDAQFLETRQFQVAEIARIFRVPPSKIAAATQGNRYSNAEMEAQEYINDGLMPWLEMLEADYETNLLTEEEQGRYFIQHDLNSLLRADSRGRAEYFAKARQWGWLNVNEIRRRENMPGIGPQGEQYLEPLNMTQVGTDRPAEEQPTNA